MVKNENKIKGIVGHPEKIGRKEVAGLIGVLIALALFILGAIPMLVAFVLDFLGELLICVAVAVGTLGEWLRRRVDSPIEKAFWGTLIVVGIAVLLFTTFIPSIPKGIILTILIDYPFYICLFMVMAGMWILFKHRSIGYGLLCICAGLAVLGLYGFGFVAGYELIILLMLVVIGFILARKRGIPFDYKKQNSHRVRNGRFR
jgi:hypothetical protein